MTSTTETTSARRRGWIAALVLFGASALAGAGCNRAHLSSYYGKSYAAWFGAQYVHTPTATSDAILH